MASFMGTHLVASSSAVTLFLRARRLRRLLHLRVTLDLWLHVCFLYVGTVLVSARLSPAFVYVCLYLQRDRLVLT